MTKSKATTGPRVLLLDVETAPIVGYLWGLWDQTIGLNQIKSDWHLLSWAAKWLDETEVMYQDQRGAKNIEDDKKLLKGIWDLIDEADIVITQNGVSFDMKKLNARFILNGMPPPSSVKHIDTKLLAKKHFGFTSNKLEYMTDKLNKKYKKLKHTDFGGFELWKECLAGNKKAWDSMKKYNMYDVLALEELYHILKPWGTGVNFSVYHDTDEYTCECGSTDVKRNGYAYTAQGKYQRYKCQECSAESRSRNNLLTEEKRSKHHARTR